MAVSRDDLLNQVAAQVPTPPLTSAEIDTLLDVARVAAHGTGDRTSAPLATFLLGIAAAQSPDRSTALTELLARVEQIAPVEAE